MDVGEAIAAVRTTSGRVRWADQMKASARDDLADAIRQANSAGVSFASIGREAGLSRQRVHQIVRARP